MPPLPEALRLRTLPLRALTDHRIGYLRRTVVKLKLPISKSPRLIRTVYGAAVVVDHCGGESDTVPLRGSRRLRRCR